MLGLFGSLAPRLLVSLAISAALIAAAAWLRHDGVQSGRGEIQARWDADIAQRTAAALAAEQASRATEQALQSKVRKVSHEYNAEKTARAAADSAAADSLRRLTAVLSSAAREPAADPAAPAGADDDPRDGIIAECAGAVVALDSAVGRLAGQTVALQKYTAGVCVIPGR